VLLLLALIVGGALFLSDVQQQSRRDLKDRFALRAGLGARFTESFVNDLVANERSRAHTQLSGQDVSQGEFERVVDALGFQAAVLLDSRGRIERVYPDDPSLVGTEIASRYPHLSAALRGDTAVSPVVPSASRHVPVVGFAIPFDSAAGRHVFSGAFEVERTPIAEYLKNALPLKGSRVYIVDSSGATVVGDQRGRGGRTFADVDPSLAAALAAGPQGSYRQGQERRYFAAAPVEGTPWRVVASVPEGLLLAPLGGPAQWVPWLLLVALGVAGATAVVLFFRVLDRGAELAAANAALAGQNDDLRQLDRMKDEFVALVSHELRTPLTSVIGYIGALRRGLAGDLTPEQDQLAGVAERNGNRLVRLVGDLLFSARADAGKLELSLAPLDLDAVVTEACESARPFADDQGIALTCEAVPGLGVQGDTERLAQLVDNLIGNALKFTPEGGTVSVRVFDGEGGAVIEVADTGIGIPEEEQGRLFERFYRASTATEREIQGTGLGLSVVRTIAELHGGAVEYESAVGAGTTFRVTLPLVAVRAAA
jgi:signal transduction histidine kinase